MGKGLFVADYGTFMSLRYAEKEKGMSGCEPREVICELGRVKLQAEIWQSSQNNRIFIWVLCVFCGLVCLCFYSGV